jgi:ATP-dependent Clp protease ATP-binding subunit ClpA
VFERFTSQARQAVHLAVAEARAMGADRIGAEHMLLGLAHGPAGPAAGALAAAGLDLTRIRALAAAAQPAHQPLDADSLAMLGIDLDQVKRAAEAAFGPGALDRPAAPRRGRTVPARMTRESKEALACALSLAKRGHENDLSAGHLLVGIIDQGDNGALRLLAAAGADPAALRADTLRRMTAAA